VSSQLGWRREHFGIFVWSLDRSEFFRLSGLDAAVFYVAAREGAIASGSSHEPEFRAAGIECRESDIDRALVRLEAGRLLIRTAPGPSRSLRTTLENFASDRPLQAAAKPIWVHLQPFTFCNLSCRHCYCYSSPSAPKFSLSVDLWREIIGKLDQYGIAEVFITGGETLILPETWLLVREIRSRRLGTGLSTNALHITPEILRNLHAYGIQRIQVSLDGGTAATHDYLRNKNGAFDKAVANLSAINRVSEPVINTTVNNMNLTELDAIVEIGLRAGVTKFKFFPQKPTGRARLLPELTLSDPQIDDVLVPLCAELSERHGVVVETMSPTSRCGSARSGFCIDEAGDAYPCIFGIGDPDQRAGNVLRDALDTIWFDSEVMQRFRTLESHPCRRCEPLAS
jgi:radical SAM protein with 4Fe4S-binding SPASM domain